ncbi:hypothetical protein ACFLQ0_05445, partial [Nitrospinota bacterium]
MKVSPQDMNIRFFTDEVERLSSALRVVVKRMATPRTEAAQRKLAAAIRDELFGKKQRQYGKSRIRSKKSEKILELFWLFAELNKSFEYLLDFEVYISRYPFHGTTISKHRYLEFVIHSYLGEVYSFKNR